jgi:hypothetical protein
VLVVAIVLPPLRYLRFISGLLLVAISLGLGAGAVLGYRRVGWMRSIVTMASPALLVFPLWFLFLSPISSLLYPSPRPQRAAVRVHNPVPVVMVVFDEFCGVSLMDEDRQIDSVRYPHFAELARDATWYRQATAVHTRSEHAVPAILTGNYPQSSRSPTVAAYPHNLFTLVHSTDHYRLVAFEPLTRLFPAAADGEEMNKQIPWTHQLSRVLADLSVVFLHHLCPTDVPIELPDISLEWHGIRPRELVSRDKRSGVIRYAWNAQRSTQFEHFLDCIVPGDAPALYFLHIAIPHFAWAYLPSGKCYRPDEGLDWTPYGAYGQNSEDWSDDGLAVLHGYQRYLLQVGFADHCVGQLVARLKTAGLYDRCLLVVMADHGASFRTNQSRRKAGPASLLDILSIPLFIKMPLQPEGAVNDHQATAIDVLPTMMEVLGIELPEQTDGNSLLHPDRLDRRARRFWNDDQELMVDPQFASHYDTHAHMLSIFGSGTGEDRLFQIGPNTELIGQRLEQLAIGSPSEIEVELLPDRLNSDAANLVGCYLEGRVHVPSDASLPVSLAIAVNGRVEAVTRTYLPPDIRQIWTAMVPEASIRLAANDIRVFEVSRAGGGLMLRQTAVRSPRK